MPENLIRLSYISTLRHDVSANDVDSIAAEAAAFNKGHGITGVLAIDGRRVCQILEGPGQAVDQLFASIERDERHHGVTMIVHQPIESLTFEEWGMVRRDMVDIAVYAMTN